MRDKVIETIAGTQASICQTFAETPSAGFSDFRADTVLISGKIEAILRVSNIRRINICQRNTKNNVNLTSI